jgi:hypothetical protein
VQNECLWVLSGEDSEDKARLTFLVLPR